MNIDSIFHIKDENQFNTKCLEVFKHQYENNTVYRQFCTHLDASPKVISHYIDIPFLPIEFFKTHKILTGDQNAEIVFSSSGTTGSITSKHYVPHIEWYEQSFRNALNQFYPGYQNHAILALLPSYLEREGSSLIYMVEDMIKHSSRQESGFFLHNHHELYEVLMHLQASGIPTLLIGVTFALLDFTEQYEIDFPELIVMETGGMKGQRREIIRQEVHSLLKSGFGVPSIHSEYGMTELLSQAYSSGQGIFQSPAWMRILIRDTNDPFTYLEKEKTGAINIIDLANYHSCSFIATQDLGKRYKDNSFEVLGRFDYSDVRGCNLLVQ